MGNRATSLLPSNLPMAPPPPKAPRSSPRIAAAPPAAAAAAGPAAAPAAPPAAFPSSSQDEAALGALMELQKTVPAAPPAPEQRGPMQCYVLPPRQKKSTVKPKPQQQQQQVQKKQKQQEQLQQQQPEPGHHHQQQQQQQQVQQQSQQQLPQQPSPQQPSPAGGISPDIFDEVLQHFTPGTDPALVGVIQQLKEQQAIFLSTLERIEQQVASQSQMPQATTPTAPASSQAGSPARSMAGAATARGADGAPPFNPFQPALVWDHDHLVELLSPFMPEEELVPVLEQLREFAVGAQGGQLANEAIRRSVQVGTCLLMSFLYVILAVLSMKSQVVMCEFRL